MAKTNIIKRIFLYDEDSPTAVHYEGAYKYVKAISDDGKHVFEFTVNQSDYGNSLKELCAKFERFCTFDCGFDNSRDCEVWSTYPAHSKVIHIHGYRGKLYSDTLETLLCGCDWAVVCDLESEYYSNCSHLRLSGRKSPPTFEEFAAANGYDATQEPYAAQKLFAILDSTVRKKIFTAEEINTIAEFIENNAYAMYWTQAKRVAIRLSRILSEKFDTDSFKNSAFAEMENIAKTYIKNTLYALDGAIIRLYKNDRRRFRSMHASLKSDQREYIAKVIKEYKKYGY